MRDRHTAVVRDPPTLVTCIAFDHSLSTRRHPLTTTVSSETFRNVPIYLSSTAPFSFFAVDRCTIFNRGGPPRVYAYTVCPYVNNTRADSFKKENRSSARSRTTLSGRGASYGRGAALERD